MKGTLDKSYSTVSYEEQAGAIADPSSAIGKTGQVVMVKNTTLDRIFLYVWDDEDESWEMIESSPASGSSSVDVETQAGEIAEPTTTAKGDGHIVKVLYTGFTPDRVVQWIYDLTNTEWFGVELL